MGAVEVVEQLKRLSNAERLEVIAAATRLIWEDLQVREVPPAEEAPILRVVGCLSGAPLAARRSSENSTASGPYDDEVRPGLHRYLALAARMLEESMLSHHPACVQNAEWFALAERAVTALGELYQKIGQEHLEA
ncbi:MAG: hypothetical protein IRY99_16090 [Isosphaeraceae bacterium]|nr:hypothetical protein [Isosphaeraceae bacterium]